MFNGLCLWPRPETPNFSKNLKVRGLNHTPALPPGLQFVPDSFWMEFLSQEQLESRTFPRGCFSSAQSWQMWEKQLLPHTRAEKIICKLLQMTPGENAEVAGQAGQSSLWDGATPWKYGEGKIEWAEGTCSDSPRQKIKYWCGRREQNRSCSQGRSGFKTLHWKGTEIPLVFLYISCIYMWRTKKRFPEVLQNIFFILRQEVEKSRPGNQKSGRSLQRKMSELE